MGGKSKRPSKPFIPTDEQRFTVRQLVGKMSEDDIASVIVNPETGRPITAKTMRKRFRKELQQGRINTKAYVIGKLFKLIEKENPASIFFYLKTQEGWRERDRDEPPPATDDPTTAAAKMRALAEQMELASRGPA